MIPRLLLVACLCAATPAFGQAAREDPKIALSREHFNNGQKLVEQGKHAEAYAEFQKGYDLSRRPLFLFNMAECARQGADPSRARDAYQRYLREDPNGAQAPKARERLAELGKASLPVPLPATAPVPAPPPPAPAHILPPAPTASPRPQRIAAIQAPAPAITPTPSSVLLAQRSRAPAPDEQARPVYRRWGFWAAVGAVVVAGVIVGLALAPQGPTVPETPLGSQRAFDR